MFDFCYIIEDFYPKDLQHFQKVRFPGKWPLFSRWSCASLLEFLPRKQHRVFVFSRLCTALGMNHCRHFSVRKLLHSFTTTKILSLCRLIWKAFNSYTEKEKKKTQNGKRTEVRWTRRRDAGGTKWALPTQMRQSSSIGGGRGKCETCVWKFVPRIKCWSASSWYLENVCLGSQLPHILVDTSLSIYVILETL